MVKSDWFSVSVDGDCDSGTQWYTYIFTPIKRPYVVISPVFKGIWPTPSVPKSPCISTIDFANLGYQDKNMQVADLPQRTSWWTSKSWVLCRIAWGATKKSFHSTFQPQKSCNLQMIGFPKPCSKHHTFLHVSSWRQRKKTPSFNIPRALSRFPVTICCEGVSSSHYHYTYRLSKHNLRRISVLINA